MNIFVISLPSAIERRQLQERQLSKLKLDYQIIRATTTSDIDDKTYQNHHYDWQRPLQKLRLPVIFHIKNYGKKLLKTIKLL